MNINKSIEDIFEKLDPKSEKHKKIAFYNNGIVHPFDIIKDLDLEMLGIYISSLQFKWQKELNQRYGWEYFKKVCCIQCDSNFKEGDFFKYGGVPLHTRCLEKWMYNNSCLMEKSIRYLARIYGNIYHGSLRGAYNPDEMRILKHFNLDKIS